MEKLYILLEEIGIVKIEKAVYCTLYAGGPLSVTDIARKTRKYRPQIYEALHVLKERGLVSEAKKGMRTIYVAAPPSRLREIAEEFLGTLERALPDLETSYRAGKDKPRITILEGRVGVTSVFADLIESQKKGETFFRYSSEKDLDRTNTYLPHDYRKKRDAKSLERFVITAPRIGRGKKVRMERAMKYIPEGYDLFDQDVIELIYADKVAFIDLNTETSFIIESAKLADFHKKLFRVLYQKL
jgi:sugar-specific transcriptional regulator TrmB